MFCFQISVIFELATLTRKGSRGGLSNLEQWGVYSNVSVAIQAHSYSNSLGPHCFGDYFCPLKPTDDKIFVWVGTKKGKRPDINYSGDLYKFHVDL